MDYTNLLLETYSSDFVYEDDFMRVIKVLKDIPTGSRNHVKRVQLVIWKSKETDVPDLDIRRFSLKDKKYSRGISFTHSEARELYETLKDFLVSE
jgi:hypothetical protein